jgi:hypothetical protein
LLIIGILAGAMMKGKDLIESAQLRSVANDMHTFRMAFAEYVNTYGSFPGNDGAATAKFGSDVKNGSGNGKVTPDEAKEVFKHLNAAKLIQSENFKIPKIGGRYEVISEKGVVKLKLSDEGQGFLSYNQVVSLTAKIKELTGDDQGDIEMIPAGSSTAGKYAIQVKIW